MKRLTTLILLSVLAAPLLSAQAPGPSEFARYALSGAEMDYPSGWKVSAIDAKGIMAVYVSPDGELSYGPGTKIPRLLEAKAPFAFLMIVTPQVAEEWDLGFDVEDLSSFVSDTMNATCAEEGRSGLQEASIGGLWGTLETGTGTNGAAIQMAAAGTVDGSALLFVSSSGADGEAYQQAFDRMRQSIAISGGLSSASAMGFVRLNDQGLRIDIPSGWHLSWSETPGLKSALLSSMDIDADALYDGSFPSTLEAGQSVAMVAVASGETGQQISAGLADGLQAMLGELGSEPQIMERGATVLAGIPGNLLSGTFGGPDNARLYAYLAAAAYPAAGAIVFLGLSPEQDSTEAQQRFSSMVQSLSFR